MDRYPTQDARRVPLGHSSCAAVLAAMLGLLALPSVGFSAADNSEPSDWRQEADFLEANEAIEAWLVNRPDGRQAIAAWREAILAAPRAARLASPLRQVAAEYDEQLAGLIAAPPGTPTDQSASIGAAEASIRLAIAEALVGRGEYDASLAWSENLSERPLFSPALLHYLRAVAARQTISDESAAEELKQFDTLGDDSATELGPARRWVLSALRRELNKEAKPLPVVVRRMRDVERRLAQAEPSDTALERQQTILDELDKLIKDLEEQRKQQQQQAAQAQAGGSGAPTNPAEESRPSELKGPGEVDRKRLVAGDAWGALPPAEREKLTQAIIRDFPPHYRGLIEDYFKTLATEADESESTSDSEAGSPQR